ncbi:lysine-sensitive aspartokinase 3 [Peredibacter sp. HCB2-198]|uniref:lysine-sensitive aspartokinase 3 n=1 Tax=Peredibacter sp. HCB2-198 TaxID=3383025 RepID=UPI0038B5EC42
MSHALIVSKFGGTSMGDLASMQRSALISAERKSTVVVVSATSGTTDKLIEIAKSASQGRMDDCEKSVFSVKERHLGLVQQAGGHEQTVAMLQSYFTELDLLVQNISLLKELTPRAYDHILSLGERMSSLIFRDVLQAALPNKKVTLLDARTVIKTDSNFGKATPQIDVIEREAVARMNLSGDQVYVTQGFIGGDSEGNTTILGRGGSDYSAALFAEGISANTLEIWTDVAGVATTDPRLCPTARIIPELSYSEAGEMAQYGAKILHPATIAPAVRKNIPVFVGSSFEKDLPGTWIRTSVDHRPAVRAITKRSAQALVTITTPTMYNAYGFMSGLFEVFGRHRVSVDCVTTSEISVAVTVDNATLENEKFIRDLEQVGNINIEAGYSLISLIGNELTLKPSLAKTIFGAIDVVNIRMMSLGASSYNFNFLVKEEDSKSVIQKLHQTLIEEV